MIPHTSPESDAVIANPLRASGLVDAAALEKARAHARDGGGLLSDALLRLNLVKEADFLRVFAELYSTRFVKAERLRALKLDEVLLERLGVRSAERLRLIPIRWEPPSSELHVVAGVPMASSLEPELRQLFGARRVTVYVATAGAVMALIRRAYYRDEDAFSLLTANGAGPLIAPGRPIPDDEEGDSSEQRTAIGRSPLAEDSEGPSARSPDPSTTGPGRDALLDTVPPPASSEGKTVMVSLEALTISTLRKENVRYRVAQEFHRRVSLERSVEAMVDRILDVLFELLPADGAAVWLAGGQFRSKAKDGRRIEVPRAIIDEAMTRPEGVLANNALVDERFDRSRSVMVRGIKSVMAVPLRSREKVEGILYVESLSMSAAFSEEDLPLFDSVAAQAAILLENAYLVSQVKKEVETRASLARFLSPAAVEEVLSGRMTVNLEGQASDITVLFADIRGFTSVSSHMRPGEVVRFLNQFFGEAVDAVERHGGIVDKFIGDCVMALWGAVAPREDDARNAIKAALEMVQRGSRLRMGPSALQLGVGINTGSAVVGAIGGKTRSDYTAIGATVNLAARLCGIADAGAVLVTSDTLMRAGPGVDHHANEPVILKGLDVPMVPYQVRAIREPLRLDQVLASPGAVGDSTLPAVNRRR